MSGFTAKGATDCDNLVSPRFMKPQQVVIGALRALPADGKPVASASWQNTDTAFLDVAKGVRRALEELRSRQ